MITHLNRRVNGSGCVRLTNEHGSYGWIQTKQDPFIYQVGDVYLNLNPITQITQSGSSFSVKGRESRVGGATPPLYEKSDRTQRRNSILEIPTSGSFSGRPFRPPDLTCRSHNHHPRRSLSTWCRDPVIARAPTQQKTAVTMAYKAHFLLRSNLWNLVHQAHIHSQN